MIPGTTVAKWQISEPVQMLLTLTPQTVAVALFVGRWSCISNSARRTAMIYGLTYGRDVGIRDLRMQVYCSRDWALPVETTPIGWELNGVAWKMIRNDAE